MNRFESEIGRSFKALKRANGQGACIYTKLVVNKQSSYGVQSPLDALVDIHPTYNYTGNLALELKELAKRSSLPFDRVPEHQIEGLLEFQEMGRRSYLLVCFRKEKLAYALPINTLLYLIDKNTKKNRKSIPPQDIESYGHALSWTRAFESGYVWDVSSL